VSAQSTSAPPGDAAQVIVVTAQKREQKVSDVPITMNAFSGDQLRESGTVELRDVANLISNTQVYRMGSGQPTWIIRGVGLVDYSPNNTPTAGVFQNDVYLTSNVMNQFGLFDVERVEVLKGPQGGLYGRNTSGGAVRIVTVKPALNGMEAEASAGIDDGGRMRLGGVYSTAVNPGLFATRLAVDGRFGGKGPVDLKASGQEAPQLEQFSLRSTSVLKMSDAARLTFTLDLGRDRSETAPNTAVGIYTAPPASGNARGICAAVLAGHLDNSTCYSNGQWTLQRYQGVSANNPSQVDPGRSSWADPIGKMDVRSVSGTFQGDFKLGGLDLISITNVRDHMYGRTTDTDGEAGEFAHSPATSKFKVWSQDLRLQGRSDNLRWAVGANYAYDKVTEDRNFLFRDNLRYFTFGSFAAYGVTAANQLNASLRYDQETEAAAVYGQADWALAPDWTLAASLRYTDENKNYRNGGFGFPQATGTIAPAVQDIAKYRLAADYKLENHWSGKVSIDHKLRPDLLVYASVSRGFKSGGFFGGFPLNGVSAILPYKEEVNTAYELGFKTDAANKTAGASVAVFHYDYKDAQSFTNVFSSLLNASISRLDNIGGARHDGLDIDGWFRPIDALRLDASLGYVHAKFTDDKKYSTLDGQVASYQGQYRPLAPKFSWSLRAAYDIPLAGQGLVRLAVDQNGRTERIRSFASNVDRAVQDLPGYALTNARVTYFSADRSLTVGAWVRNVTDKRYWLFTASDGLGGFVRFYGEPRTFGLDAQYRF
jgi:iron complex outermembrane receptor protein